MKSAKDPLKTLIGSELSSVEFVRDYLQFRFDGPTITAFTLPKVRIGERTYERGVFGYCDTLCSCISSTISAASVVEDEEMTLVFDDGKRLTISLKPEDYQGTEAVVFRKDSDELWVW